MFSELREPQLSLLNELYGFARRVRSIPELIEAARSTRVGTTSHELVSRRGRRRLLRYRRDTPARYAEPILFCYGLINRHYILDLQSDNSVVRQYLARGFDVYIIDWGIPSAADHALTLEDYVCGYLRDAVEQIRRAHGGVRIHLLGYCMGGTMATLLTALAPESVATLSLLAAPIDFGGRESLLNLWAERTNFDVDALIEAYGNCPAWLLQWSFLLLKPVQNMLEKYLALYEKMTDRKFVESYFAIEHWSNDNIPVAGATFREFVKKFYQGNQLVRGELRLGAERVDLARIACPLLLLTAANDHLVPPPSTHGIRAHVRADDVATMSIDSGHVGMVVSGKAHEKFWPEATRWLTERSTPVSQ